MARGGLTCAHGDFMPANAGELPVPVSDADESQPSTSNGSMKLHGWKIGHFAIDFLLQCSGC